MEMTIKDFEEQIGMSLEFIFLKVIGHDIYHIDDEGIMEERAIAVGREHEWGEYGDWEIKTDCCWTFRLADYGISWWLSEEEAENELKKMKNDSK